MAGKIKNCTRLPAQSRQAIWPPVLHELHRQLRQEMALAGYQATDLLIATDDVIHRELVHAGQQACLDFVALWVRVLREQNRAWGDC